VEVGVGRVGAQQGYVDAFKMIAQSQEVDLILTHLNPEAFIIYGGAPEWLNESISALIGVFKTLPKPVALVLPPGETAESKDIVERAWDQCLDEGLAVFRSYESAANAISKLADYSEFLDRV